MITEIYHLLSMILKKLKKIIDYLKWNVWNQKAQIKVRVNKLYTNNLKEIYYNPDGR